MDNSRTDWGNMLVVSWVEEIQNLVWQRILGVIKQDKWIVWNQEGVECIFIRSYDFQNNLFYVR